MKGFDQLDGMTDLSTVLEDLPTKLNALSLDQYPIELYLYEQGIQRRIIFEENEASLKATCWGLKTNPYKEVGRGLISKESLESQLRKLKQDFIEVVTTAFPKRSSSHFFKEWCDSFND